MASRVKIDQVALNRILESPTGPAARVILSATVRVERRAKQLLSRKGSGRVYRRGVTKGGRRRFHQASAPGQPPAADTGLLRASINRELSADGRGLVGRVGTSVKYGRYLELGTTKMRARPFLRPALEAADPKRAAQVFERERILKEGLRAQRARVRAERAAIRERRRTLLDRGDEA